MLGRLLGRQGDVQDHPDHLQQRLEEDLDVGGGGGEAGARPEPLLGDHNEEDLGIISFHPEGRQHQGSDEDEGNYKDVMNVSIPAKLRKAGKEVITERPPLHKVKTKGKEEATKIINRYKGPVFTDRVGKMPVQPARYPVPYHYQERLATQLT